MQLQLDGKVALVSGGSRGIGAAIVRIFAQAGAKVAISYINSSVDADALVSSFPEGQLKAYHSDASDANAAQLLIDHVVADFGRIDVLVNNAGITRDNLLLRMTENQWDEVMQANLKSVYNLSRPVSKVMLRQKSGSIIHIGSVVGVSGNPGQANYAASKAGIIAFSKSIAQELGIRQIRSNVITPGYIQTDMTSALSEELKINLLNQIPLKRLGQPDDVAQMALFLASDASAYITGQTFSVCGGMLR